MYNCLLSVSGVTRSTGSAIASGGAGAAVMGIPASAGLDPVRTAPVPVARVWPWNGCWIPPSLLALGSQAVASAATVRGLGLQDTDSAVPLVPAPPCISVLLPLGLYGPIHCEILWHPVVLGRGTF